MANLIPRKDDLPSSLPRSMDPETDTTLRILLNKLIPPETGTVFEEGARTKERRERMERRRDYLKAKLEPCDPTALKGYISRLFLGYPALRSWDEADAVEFRDAVAHTLAEFPEWVLAAILRDADHRLPASEEFPPPERVLRDIASSLIAPMLAEWDKVNRVLNAIAPEELEPESPERRAHVVREAWEKVRPTMGMVSDKPASLPPPPEYQLAALSGRTVEETAELLKTIPNAVKRKDDKLPEHALDVENRKKVASQIAEGTDWHIAGLLKARGINDGRNISPTLRRKLNAMGAGLDEGLKGDALNEHLAQFGVKLAPGRTELPHEFAPDPTGAQKWVSKTGAGAGTGRPRPTTEEIRKQFKKLDDDLPPRMGSQRLESGRWDLPPETEK